MLAYDVLTNPGRAQRRETYRAQGERWAAFYKSFYEKYKDAPPGAVRDIAEEYGRQIPVAPERLAQKTKRFEAYHIDAARSYGMAGLVLIAVGSLMQSAAALLAAP